MDKITVCLTEDQCNILIQLMDQVSGLNQVSRLIPIALAISEAVKAVHKGVSEEPEDTRL